MAQLQVHLTRRPGYARLAVPRALRPHVNPGDLFTPSRDGDVLVFTPTHHRGRGRAVLGGERGGRNRFLVVPLSLVTDLASGTFLGERRPDGTLVFRPHELRRFPGPPTYA